MSDHVRHEIYDRCMYCTCKETIFDCIGCVDEPRVRSRYLDDSAKEALGKSDEQRTQELIAFIESAK